MQRILDRRVEFDIRSKSFPIRTAEIATKQPRSYTWGCKTYLDQGQEGACVGFAWAHELAAVPLAIVTTNNDARDIYYRAQQLDQWPGENYSGTSVIAGAKAVQELRHGNTHKTLMPEYRWAFGIDDLILAVGYKGPAVLGLNWYSGMFDADNDGFIHPTGSLEGGHAILTRRFRFVKANIFKATTWDNMDRDRSFFMLHNSWGQEWGVNGTCKISVNELSMLLQQQGEACVPTIRV